MHPTFQDNVVIYSQNNCPACVSAKALLTSKGKAYTEVNLSTDVQGKAALQAAAPGARSVPQIVINGIHLGGLDMLRTYLNRK